MESKRKRLAKAFQQCALHNNYNKNMHRSSNKTKGLYFIDAHVSCHSL